MSSAEEGKGAGEGEIFLGIDFGSDRSISSVVKNLSEQPTLVRNNLSNDSTPTAVAFAAGSRRCSGDEALEQPASNASNVISNIPRRMGVEGPVSVGYGSDGAKQDFPMQHVLAMFVNELRGHAAVQGADPTSVIIACPQAYTPAQYRAVEDAGRIAGLPKVHLASSCTALAFHYAERHGDEAFPAADAADDASRIVMFVDVGHSFSSAAVVSYSKDRMIKVMSAVGTDKVGGGVFDEVLMDHFRAQLRSKFGEDQAKGPKFEFRLRRHCEKLKKLLSTIESARVDADSLLPDSDCSLVLKRSEFDGLVKPALEALSSLISDALSGASSPDPGTIASVEVVGGGARVPCVLDTIRKVSGHAQTKHTLDSSAAISFGAASLAKMLAPTSPAPAAAEDGDAAAAAAPVATIDGAAFIDAAGSDGMSEEEVAGAVKQEAAMRETDRLQREAQDARNSLEEWVYSIRNALDGRSGSLLDRGFTEGLLDEVEEWLGGDDFEAGVYRDKHQETIGKLKEKCGEYFVKEEELRVEAEAREKEEEARRKKEEEENRSSEDHDNRVLKFADRYAMADKNKAEGNELFKDGNCKFAAERLAPPTPNLARTGIPHLIPWTGALVSISHVRLMFLLQYLASTRTSAHGKRALTGPCAASFFAGTSRLWGTSPS